MKASDKFKVYQNIDGPKISTVSRNIIEKDGYYYKDIDGTNTVNTVNDWHNSPSDRAKAYVEELDIQEKIALLFTSDWRMGPKYPNRMFKDHIYVPDESGLLDEAELHATTIFGRQDLPGTSTLIKDWKIRHTILRENATPEDIADYHNQLHYMAEASTHFIPVETMSNSRNENGEVVFGMNDASGKFTAYPGTLGIASAILGDSIEIADHFGEVIRKEWNSAGLRKGYMYMADCVTDPRWQRTFGTFGENPELISKIFKHVIPAVQGSENGVTTSGVAMTVKHFPGGGARENGFDPHYKAGQWNVYATEGSLQKYHLPSFIQAVKSNTSSIMPYYSKPSIERSGKQYDMNGNEVKMDPYGFAYNKYFIDDLLRKQIGFKGYINSDTGIVHNMCWGVEKLDVPERIAFAINQSGVDLISGLFDQEEGYKAYLRGIEGYYDTHEVPEGFKKEDLILTKESIDRAASRSLTEMFALGLFDDPYRSLQEAKENTKQDADMQYAYQVHQKSAVLLKNKGVLPIKESTKVYPYAITKGDHTGLIEGLKSSIVNSGSKEDSDVVIIMINPKSGNYFNATPGYLELEICENKVVHNVDEDGKPLDTTHLESTVTSLDEFYAICDTFHQANKKVIGIINFPLAWIVGSVEGKLDAIVAGFDTYTDALLDVIYGKVDPTGKLPITLPKGDEVIKVDKDGKCISPNDVPGYDKDQYMPDHLKDENGKAYAYKDECGNYYEYNFGLNY